MVHLVQEDDHRGHFHLAGEQHVLARLGHRAIRSAHDQDRAVHLRRARDHVLDIVTVAGAVDVRIVARIRLVFDVTDVDRDTARFFFRGVVDIGIRHLLRFTLQRQHLRDRGGQRGLAVVNVTNRADVDVRLAAVEFFRHFLASFVTFITNPKI